MTDRWTSTTRPPPSATITVKGKVVKKWEEGKDKLIECEIESADGNGTVKLTGSFVAVLP
jgi:hypothetical protein